jgi:hypothetical protein
LARARGFTESTDVKDLEVVQEGWDERVLGRARRMAEDTAAPIPIYMDKKFYWIRLHEPPPQLHGAQAYYIDRFPPKDENPAVINLDVFPVSSRIMEAKRVDLPKLELFGNSGDGRMAVLLVREDNETLRVLPRRLDQLRARAADAKRLASGKDKASREAAAAEDLEGEADAERVRWLVSTLPPEHLWLARRDYTLLSTSDR